MEVILQTLCGAERRMEIPDTQNPYIDIIIPIHIQRNPHPTTIYNRYNSENTIQRKFSFSCNQVLNDNEIRIYTEVPGDFVGVQNHSDTLESLRYMFSTLTPIQRLECQFLDAQRRRDDAEASRLSELIDIERHREMREDTPYASIPLEEPGISFQSEYNRIAQAQQQLEAIAPIVSGTYEYYIGHIPEDEPEPHELYTIRSNIARPPTVPSVAPIRRRRRRRGPVEVPDRVCNHEHTMNMDIDENTSITRCTDCGHTLNRE